MDTGGRERGVGRLVGVRGGEWRTLVLSGAYFFLLLFGYFLLRPLREAMGVQRSMGDLRWLFLVTCVVSLAATLAFGSAVSRLDRARFIGLASRVVIGCLLVFVALRLVLGEDGRTYTGYVFYVWLSVVNLFLVSVFWAFMADVWSLEQGKRLFPVIGVGGTLGALLGSMFAWQLAPVIGPAWQMVGACVCFEASVWIARGIDAGGRARTGRPARAIGGRWADGAAAVARSPYLLGIGAYIALIAVSSTLIYFTQAKLVSDAADELERRVALFAQLDTWTQLATLLVQLFVTRHMIGRLGVGVTLMVLPVVTVAGFAALAWVEAGEAWIVFGVFAAFNALHRATRYAVARPTRETLFSVVSESEKYKAKPIVDVFLYRGGDVAGVAVERLVAAVVIGLGGMLAAAAPLAVLWGGLSVWLAAQQRRRAGGGESFGSEAAPSAASA